MLYCWHVREERETGIVGIGMRSVTHDLWCVSYYLWFVDTTGFDNIPSDAIADFHAPVLNVFDGIWLATLRKQFIGTSIFSNF